MKLLRNNNAFTQLVPLVLGVVIVFALIFVGAYINGTIHEELEDSVDGTKAINNWTRSSMNNSSANWDSSLDIVQVVIIITILASAIGAIFVFTRFGR